MAILVFLTNTQIEAQIGGTSSGDGPMRLVQYETEWRVVVVNGTEIVGTLAQFASDMSSVDKNIPIALIERPQA